jgi:hypothetical protein
MSMKIPVGGRNPTLLYKTVYFYDSIASKILDIESHIFNNVLSRMHTVDESALHAKYQRRASRQVKRSGSRIAAPTDGSSAQTTTWEV